MAVPLFFIIFLSCGLYYYVMNELNLTLGKSTVWNGFWLFPGILLMISRNGYSEVHKLIAL